MESNGFLRVKGCLQNVVAGVAGGGMIVANRDFSVPGVVGEMEESELAESELGEVVVLEHGDVGIAHIYELRASEEVLKLGNDVIEGNLTSSKH